jgi:Leucine-rich repeat (LRR) protein
MNLKNKAKIYKVFLFLFTLNNASSSPLYGMEAWSLEEKDRESDENSSPFFLEEDLQEEINTRYLEDRIVSEGEEKEKGEKGEPSSFFLFEDNLREEINTRDFEDRIEDSEEKEGVNNFQLKDATDLEKEFPIILLQKPLKNIFIGNVSLVSNLPKSHSFFYLEGHAYSGPILPPEIWGNVFEYAGLESLPAIRLVCKHWSLTSSALMKILSQIGLRIKNRHPKNHLDLSKVNIQEIKKFRSLGGQCPLEITSIIFKENMIRDEDLLTLEVFLLKNLEKLTYLTLSHNSIMAEASLYLLWARGWNPKLKFLDLSYNYLSDRGGLEDIGTITTLTDLNLSENKLSDESIAPLSSLLQLRRLNLACNGGYLEGYGPKPFTGQGLSTIGALTTLTDLNLFNNKITDKGASEISTLTNLTYLNLAENSLHNKALIALSPLLKITSLNLRGNYLVDGCLAQLSSLKNLTYLDLSYNDITISNDINTFQGLYALNQLVFLNLTGNDLRDNHLQEIRTLPNLRLLKLSRNEQITNQGLVKYIGNLFTQLASLNIRMTAITEKEARVLRKKFPHLTIKNREK